MSEIRDAVYGFIEPTEEKVAYNKLSFIAET